MFYIRREISEFGRQPIALCDDGERWKRNKSDNWKASDYLRWWFAGRKDNDVWSQLELENNKLLLAISLIGVSANANKLLKRNAAPAKVWASESSASLPALLARLYSAVDLIAAASCTGSQSYLFAGTFFIIRTQVRYNVLTISATLRRSVSLRSYGPL